MTIIQNPKILKNVFNETNFNRINNLFVDIKKNGSFDKTFSRWCISDFNSDKLKNYLSSLTDLARITFDSKTLIPTYALFSHYEGKDANLFKHKDNNACTYTIDLCVYQKFPWDLYVEGIPYTLHPNEALAYYGNDQEHWREDFTNPETNHVGMIFFHFAEPDHWWFNNRKSYQNVIS